MSGLNPLPLTAAEACWPLYSLYSALCSLQFTSPLDFGGNPMTFFVCPHFHPDYESWSLCSTCTQYRPYIEHCRAKSTVNTMSQKKRSPFRYNFVYKQPIFIIFGILILREITNGAERGAGGRGVGAERGAEITEVGFNAERQNNPLRSAPVIG